MRNGDMEKVEENSVDQESHFEKSPLFGESISSISTLSTTKFKADSEDEAGGGAAGGTDDRMKVFWVESEPLTTSQMTSLICKLAVPAIFTNVMGFLAMLVNTVFAGRMDDPAKLAAVGLTNVVVGTMILSLMIGLNSAQETLTSQAFGAGNRHLCGIYLNRGRCILIAFYIPLALIPALFAQQILVAIGQDPKVSHLTQIQIWYMLPSVLCFGLYDLQKRWLACMRITLAPMVAMMGATALHVPLCLIFVNGLDMDIRGLAIANSVKDMVLLASIVIYSCYYSEEDIRPVLRSPLDREALRCWGEYLKISLPSTVMICAEWWAFEILVVISGTLGVQELAAQVILFSVINLLFMVSLGLQEATCGVIGNCIGANNVPLAKRFFSLLAKLSLTLTVLLSLLTCLLRWQIVTFWTHDAAVQQIAAPVLALLSLNYVFDGTQGFLQGPIRAMGLQETASYCSIASHYLVGIPSAYLMAIKFNYGVLGLQIGIGLAVLTQFVCYGLILLRTSWQTVADGAQTRMMPKAEDKTGVVQWELV